MLFPFGMEPNLYMNQPGFPHSCLERLPAQVKEGNRKVRLQLSGFITGAAVAKVCLAREIDVLDRLGLGSQVLKNAPASLDRYVWGRKLGGGETPWLLISFCSHGIVHAMILLLLLF